MLWRMPADLRRERIGMMFINTDVSRAAARSSSAACTARAAGRRLVHGRQKTTGGKVGKVGNPFRASIAVRKNYRSPWRAPAQYRVVSLGIGADAALGGRRPRCLTKVGAAPILPHRKNGLKSRKHKAF